MMHRFFRGLWILLLVGLVSACAGTTASPSPTPSTAVTGAATAPSGATPAATTEAGSSGKVVRLMTHDSFNISVEAIAAFEQQTGAKLEVVKAGDAGSALNQAILSKANPVADVFFGVDNTFLSRALTNDLFEPYESPTLPEVPAEFQLDPEHRATPIDYGDVCLNYDREYFERNTLAPPASLQDLTKPEYKGLTVVMNPATSSPGLAFLMTTIATLGESGWQPFWEALRANDVLVTDGWEDAYYGQFSGGSGQGERPIVVSYASSPAAEVFYADPQPEESPTANLLAPGSCFRQIEFAGILRNAAEPELARAVIDWMLSPAFQSSVPLNMFVYPVRDDVELPEVFVDHAALSDAPVTLDPEQIEANREAWVEAWTTTVLR